MEAATHSLKEILLTLGWAVNEDKVQGPGLFVKFLGIIWSGETKVVVKAIIDKIQAHTRPMTAGDNSSDFP